jgi:hypothetical protein
MIKKRMSDAAIKEIEAVNAQIRLLMVKRNRLLSTEAEKEGCPPDLWQFDTNTYEFVPKERIVTRGPVGAKNMMPGPVPVKGSEKNGK